MGLGILCCGGNAPFDVAMSAKNLGRDVHLALIDVFFTDNRLKTMNHEVFSVGKAGAILNYFKRQECREVIIVGNAKMPNLLDIKPDFQGMTLLGKIVAMKNRGDDAVLRVIADFFEKNNLKVLSPKDFLYTNRTVISTKTLVTSEQMADIEYGVAVLDKISDLDIGQSIVVCEKRVIGVEAVEGTDALIQRCGEYCGLRYTGKPILIKKPKITQDLRLDTPTIGIKTIENIAKFGFAGIAFSQDCLLVDSLDELTSLADESGIFIYEI